MNCFFQEECAVICCLVQNLSVIPQSDLFSKILFHVARIAVGPCVIRPVDLETLDVGPSIFPFHEDVDKCEFSPDEQQTGVVVQGRLKQCQSFCRDTLGALVMGIIRDGYVLSLLADHLPEHNSEIYRFDSRSGAPFQKPWIHLLATGAEKTIGGCRQYVWSVGQLGMHSHVAVWEHWRVLDGSLHHSAQ